MVIKYDVGVGGASANGTVFVDDNAIDDDIIVEIMNDLYEVSYKKKEVDDSTIEISYEVNVGGGCTNGTTFVSKNASEQEIILKISYNLYYFDYEKISEEDY